MKKHRHAKDKRLHDEKKFHRVQMGTVIGNRHSRRACRAQLAKHNEQSEKYGAVEHQITKDENQSED